MKRIVFMLIAIALSVAFISTAGAEISSVSVEEREKEIGELINESVREKDMKPEATMLLQNPAVSSLAQPTVSTLAQPHETLSMSGILDLIKAATNIVTPVENFKPE